MKGRGTIIKQCNFCGEDFLTSQGQLNHGYGKFCCKQCGFNYKSKKGTLSVSCHSCNKDFTIYVSRRIGKHIYCSRKCSDFGHSLPEKYCMDCGKPIGKYKPKRCYSCAAKHKGGGRSETTFFCDYCNKEKTTPAYEYKRRKNHFCNKKCEGLWRRENIRGSRCGSWKGGVVKFYAKLRKITKYLEWRNNVFIRDSYTCKKCGKIGGKLEAHHVISFSHIIKHFKITSYSDAEKCEILWSVSNGITYCKKCHKEIHDEMKNNKMKKQNSHAL